MRRQHWKFAAIGFTIGILIALTDLLEWRGRMLLPWNSAPEISHNLGHFIGISVALGIIGLIVGFFVKRPA